MIATPYSTESMENDSGHYCPLTKSLYRAAIDSGYPIIVMSEHWVLVGAGDVRFLISKVNNE